MAEKRVHFQNIVENQLPTYVQTEFPLVSDFLKSYYVSQEFQGAPVDLIQNIDDYTKIDNLTNLTEHVGLGSDINFAANTISVDLSNYPAGTEGFPDAYGLLKIDDEIITYKSKDSSNFKDCVRGFSGISSYRAADRPDQLVFDSTIADKHEKGTKIENLSNLFLKDFLVKTKHQLLPGFEERKLHNDINHNIFIKNATDFYRSKGTDGAFEILFKALYNEPVEIIRPREFLFTPSNAHYLITNDFCVEGVEGNPMELENATLFQDKYGDPTFIEKAYAPITNVEVISPGITGIAKTYYKISLDAGYNRDSRVQGATYGEFVVHPKTRLIGGVSVGATIFDVDSTVGFPYSGELSVVYNDTTSGIVSYSSKNLNQFFDCTNVTGIIEDSEDVGINTYCYAASNTGDGSTVKVRVTSVLNDFAFGASNRYYSHNDVAEIKTLGVKDNSFKGRAWFYNVASQYNVKSIELIDSSDKTYLVNLETVHSFRVGDNVALTGTDKIEKPISIISEIKSTTSFIVKGQGDLTTTDSYTVNRKLLKSISNTYPESSRFITNVQNTYKQGNDFLVASPSIPTYNSQPLNVSDQTIHLNGQFAAGGAWQITTTKDHGFYTGDAVYYTPEKVEETYVDSFGDTKKRVVTYTYLWDEGLYFVKRLDASRIRLAKSLTDISNGNFIELANTVTVKDNKIEPYKFNKKTLESQRILRSIHQPVTDSTITKTRPGRTGILINGVEVQNYKGKQVVYSGKIEELEVLAPGDDYDVMNPPLLSISDNTGIGATGNVDILGNLKSIQVKDTGFDYRQTPTITITGGNGDGATARPNMKLVDHNPTFNAQSVNDIGIGATQSIIGFTTFHKFRNNEPVYYRSEGQDGLVGLATNGLYYVHVVDEFQIKLMPTQGDAIVGINTMVITDYGVGRQSLETVHQKLVLDSVNIVNSGSGYAYKKRTTTTAGIDTSANLITINNHGYKSGEIVNYTTENPYVDNRLSGVGTFSQVIAGLSSSTDYYVTVIDDNSFKLSQVGIATIDKTIYYDTQQFIDLSSVGFGYHCFNYPSINVSILGLVGISTVERVGVSTVDFQAKLQPIFRGSIQGVHMKTNGIGYGSSTIMDNVRQPSLGLSFGDRCQLACEVIDGALTEVIVINRGNNYISPPDILVQDRAGSGRGAVVVPIISEGQVIEVKVLSGGTGYSQQNTVAFSVSPGGGAEFKASLQNWRVNLVGKHFNQFTLDDGFMTEGWEGRGLQYTHLYAPRVLRESIYATDQDGNKLYGQKDLTKQNGSEVSSIGHSPIIGWAYDGNPIYGPYGYSDRRGGVVTQMKSGYKLNLKKDRPSTVFFPEGFFIEDYTYTPVNDDSVLDENNGRFCITPEYPDGTYAYFATVDTAAASAGPFLEYREPKFPYLIGDAYHSIPNKFNLDKDSSQDAFDFSEGNWFRNTEPYNLIEENLTYKYAYIPNKLSQKIDILSTSRGVVDYVGVSSGGRNYRVNDEIVFDNADTAAVRQGSRLTNVVGVLALEMDPNAGAKARVATLEGAVIDNVSVAKSSISGVEVYPANTTDGRYILWAENPHNFDVKDVVTLTGFSTTSSLIEGSYEVGIPTSHFRLVGIGTSTVGVGSTGATGIVTHFRISGDLSYPTIRENDILGIGTERIKVLNVDPLTSRIRVMRAVDGTVGISHTASTPIYDDPRKLIINAGFKSTTEGKVNKQLYFDPTYHVGVGTSVGVGIGSTVYFDDTRAGLGITYAFIPTRSLYIENHGYEQDDQLTYSPGDGDGIVAAATTTEIQGSVYFDGYDDYMTSTESSYSINGSTNFTVEAWVFPQWANLSQIFNLSVGSASNIGLTLGSTNPGDIRLLVEADNGGDLLDITTGADLVPVGQWTHVAVSLYGTAGKIFINGVVEASGTLSGTRTHTGTVVHIGAHKTAASQDRYFRGKLSNLRYTVGEAVYTAAFTPPVLPTTKTSQAAAGTNVKLLCCKSQVSAAATVVGAGISVFGDTIATGASPAFEIWAGTGTTLTNGETVYANRISKDLLGISTCKLFINEAGNWVGIASTQKHSSTLFFTGIGTGTYHSFNTNFTPITCEVRRNQVTVSTAGTHGLVIDDNVIVEVNPSNTGIVTVKYNDYNRKLTLDAKSFTASGITSSTNTITITDHGFTLGQKIIHTATTPTYGLYDNEVYYTVPVDDNNFKLCNTYYNATRFKPIVVGIGTSASAGTINPVNPPIKVYKDSVLSFDLSDSSLAYSKGSISYPAFDFQLYADSACVKEWNKNPSTEEFQVKKSGRVGIDADAKLELTVDKYLPETLYYRLVPVFENDLPLEKEEIDVDKDILNNHEIDIFDSVYDGQYKVRVGVGSTNTFSYTVADNPEKVSYAGTTSVLSYTTNASGAMGAVNAFEVTDGGGNYYSIPGVSTVTSADGKYCIAEASSQSIGKITKSEIRNMGFNFPSDPTLEPSVALPLIVSIKEFARVESVGIASAGRGYSSSPNLRIFDGKTEKYHDEFRAKYNLKEQKVTILENVTGIHNVTPYIIPTENTNGVGISTVGFNSTTKDVTLTLSVGFTTSGTFPFALGDKIIVENVSVGLGSTGTGYNSADYNFKLFTVNAVDENIGGIGTIAYSLLDQLDDGETPGVYDGPSSAGRVVPQKHFPIFNISVKPADYFQGEEVTSTNQFNEPISGTVDRWDRKVGLLKISTIDKFQKDKVILGSASHVHGRANSIETYPADLTYGAFSKRFHGWETDSGVLNYSLQKIEDSLYYQNFSYSVKSRIDYDTWKDPVSTLNHTLGFRKFSDLQIESEVDEGQLTVGLSTEVTSVNAVHDLFSAVSMHSVSDFDLVKENSRNGSAGLISDEVIFENRILSDYAESQSNRVLTIDDMSGTFNSNPRATVYSIVDTFTLSEHRAKKYFALIKDQRYTGQRQLMIVDLMHDGTFGYINQYAKIDNVYDLGTFDFQISGTEGQVLFYPTRFKKNDYYVTTLAYNLDDNYLGIGTTSLGCVYIDSTSTKVSAATTQTTVVGFGTTYRSAKILVSVTPDAGGDGETINSEDWEFEEINLLHDGSEVDILEYGEMVTNSANLAQGFGTYSAYIQSGTVKLDFHPNAGIGTTCIVNTMQVAIGNTTTGIGTVSMKHALLEARANTIASSGSPIPVGIASFPTQFNPETDGYDGAYVLVQATDTTNNEHQLSEFFVLEDYSEESGIGTAYDTEWANIETLSGLGTIGSRLQKNQGGVSYCEITFTPNANIGCQVNTYMNALKIQDDDKDTIEFNNGTIETNNGTYRGTLNDIKRDFPLTHNNEEIFNRDFVGNASTVVSVGSSTITLPNHFFVSGEKVEYIHAGIGATQAIGIASTSFVGIGTTTKVPGDVYVIKINEDTIKLASSAENALKVIPEALNFTSVGIGSSHRFVSTNQNSKVVLALDNVIQSPVVATAVTSHLSQIVFTTDDIFYFSGITSFFAEDLVRLGAGTTGEIVQITEIGVGVSNGIRVDRGWMGTPLAGYSTDTVVTKVDGAYNIVQNTLNFVDAPVGNTPMSSDTNYPDDRDWTGISTGYSFQGRMFMRSGITGGTNEAYYSNYIIDNISNEFNGIRNNFDLKVNGSDFAGISTGGLILINSVVQGRGETYDYTVEDSSGITTISFVGNARTIKNDIGISTFPVGGIVVSVGSTEGFGYQPLISAGATAVVSSGGTIASISIGNSGSGYRAGIQTVNVGISSQGLDATYFTGIATAIINNGYITGISSVSGIGTLALYSQSSPPLIKIEAPLSYSNMPLIYSSESVSGVGSTATIDIVVGQGSSVISYTLKNLGYGYGNGEILTVPVGGYTGIPTTADFGSKEFQLTIDEVFNDAMTAWNFGELDMLDKIEDLFDNSTTTFQLKKNGAVLSILSAKGSKINVQDCLLIFVNDILQIPGKAYEFNGGSLLRFTEAPKEGDTCKIMFYKGTATVDVNDVEVLETVKPGDDIIIGWDPGVDGQFSYMQEEERETARVDSTDTITTTPYFGPGNTQDEALLRPVVWVRQTEDRIINDKEVGKDREIYEPTIYPAAYVIKTVGIGSTEIYVDNIRPFFDPDNESGISLNFQDKIAFIGQENKTGAAATAVVSGLGTISSVVISDGGAGYSTATVSIGNTMMGGVGIGTTTTAFASVTIGAAGTITGIAITNPGYGYTTDSPPQVLISPPAVVDEVNSVNSYEGDNGVIVGFGTTTSNQIMFDLHIPYDSELRNTSRVATAVSLSSLASGDYFIINNSNVGVATTSMISLDGSSTLGIATHFVDTVYKVTAAVSISTSVSGVSTYVRRVTVGVGSTPSGWYGTVGVRTSDFYGDYSWGLITLPSRAGINSFQAYNQGGIGVAQSSYVSGDYAGVGRPVGIVTIAPATGIHTSAIVQRFKPLKYKNYTS
jgi:hypothetical protein